MTTLKTILSLTRPAMLMLAAAMIAVPIAILIASWDWLNGKDFDHRELDAFARNSWGEVE